MDRKSCTSHYTLKQMRRLQRQLDHLRTQDAPEALLVAGSPQPSTGVIVFPGSFNPPTIAHLALLKEAWRYAREHEPLSLYAAFSKRTVDKETVERPLLVDRILLLETILKHRLAGTGIMLLNRGLYVEQAEAIRASFPFVKRIFFLLGFDKIVQIFDPHYYQDRDAALEALFSLAELLVAPRGQAGETELQALLHQPQNERFARFIHILPFPMLYRNISSTHIRQGGKDYMHEVPREARQFMRETRAYAPPIRYKDGSEVDFYGERVNLLETLLHQKLL